MAQPPIFRPCWPSWRPPNLAGEQWFMLWSALCHQEEVYSASFASVPHIVRILASDPTRANYNFFQLPACIEIARARHSHSFPIPEDLRQPYFEALRQLPVLVGAAAARSWDNDFLCASLAAIAVAKGFPSVAEAVLELTAETAKQFLSWFHDDDEFQLFDEGSDDG